MSYAFIDRHDHIAVITISNPPVNALSRQAATDLSDLLTQAQQDPVVSGVVITGAGRTFIAGADIRELQQAIWGNPEDLIFLHSLLIQVEDSPKPVLMALHGAVLGGGLELAMAGHYRVALPNTQFGQPEINLGLIPGAEGTQRLPRLVGPELALQMCLTGKPIGAEQALTAGLIDEIVTGELLPAALSWLGNRPVRKSREMSAKLPSGEAFGSTFKGTLEAARKSRPNEAAVELVVQAIKASVTLPYESSWRRERELFITSASSAQSKALIHAFLAERAAAKVPGLATIPTPDVRTVAIIGAGTMGANIAVACADSGFQVILKDSSAAELERGLQRIERGYEFACQRNRITSAEAALRRARIKGQLDLEGVESAGVVIEAVPEDLELKRAIFAEVSQLTSADCILCTNTSTLRVADIAAATARPSSVVGLHFFNPANIMRLVEVVRTSSATQEAVATAFGFARQLGKLAILASDCPGFIGNRMMMPYLYEAQLLVEEGASISQVDAALKQFGMAMGPFALQDTIGLDILSAMQKQLPPRGGTRPTLLATLAAAGRLGRKSGSGWFSYQSGAPIVDDEIEFTIRQSANRHASALRAIPDAEIVERSVYALVIEGARLLEEGCALRASDIDVVYLNGYGFPKWRGGPLCYADIVGLPQVLDTMSALQLQHGERWRPSPLLERLGAAGARLIDFVP